jgi:hypothetical protein
VDYGVTLLHFVAPEMRVKRARQLIGTLNRQLQRWVDAHQDFITIGRDPSGQFALVLDRMDATHLTRASITMGEVVYNLRSALDFTVYELAVIGTGKPVRYTQFPIEDRPEVFEMRITGLRPDGSRANANQRYLRGIRTPAVDVIRDLQPCQGCAWTKALRDLSNPDKHMHLPNLQSRVTPTIHESRIDPEPETGLHSISVRYDAEVEVRFLNDGLPVVETLEALHREVKAGVALLKSVADRT